MELANILFFVLSFVFLVLAWVLWFFLEAAKGLVGFIEVFARAKVTKPSIWDVMPIIVSLALSIGCAVMGLIL